MATAFWPSDAQGGEGAGASGGGSHPAIGIGSGTHHQVAHLQAMAAASSMSPPHSPGSLGRNNSRASSPRSPVSPASPVSPRTQALHSRATEQAHRLQFVKKHIGELLNIVYATAPPSDDTTATTTAGAAAASGAADATAGGGAGAGAGAGAVSSQLARTALDRLGLLVIGGSSPYTRTASLAALSPWFTATSASTASVGPGALSEWLLKNLTVNEVQYPPVSQASPAPTPGGTIAPTTVVPTISSAPLVLCSKQFEVVKPAPPSSLKPTSGEAIVAQPTIVSGIHRATVLQSAAASTSTGAELPAIRIDSCTDSFIYALSPFSFASVLGCTNCTIVVGAVAQALLVEHCEGVRVVAGCRRLRVSNSVDSKLFLATLADPLVVGDCRGVQFAPHNAPYRDLRAHMTTAGLLGATEKLSSFAMRRPRLMSSGTDSGADSDSGTASAAASSHFSFLSPTAYHTIVVPTIGSAASASASVAVDAADAAATAAKAGGAATADGSGATAGAGSGAGAQGSYSLQAANTGAGTLGLPLPAEYKEGLSRQRQSVRSLRRSIREGGLTNDQKKDLQGAIQAQFREWLVTSSNIRQVTDLVRLHRECAKPDSDSDASASGDAASNNNSSSSSSSSSAGSSDASAAPAAPATGRVTLTTEVMTTPPRKVRHSIRS